MAPEEFERPGVPVRCSGHSHEPCEAFQEGMFLGRLRAARLYPLLVLAGGAAALAGRALGEWFWKRSEGR